MLIHTILTEKNDLTSWKSFVEKLDIDKLKIVSSDVSKVKNVEDNAFKRYLIWRIG